MTYGILGLLVLIVDIYAIVQVLGSSEAGAPKILWVLGIALFPLVGVIVWYFAGPRAAR